MVLTFFVKKHVRDINIPVEHTSLALIHHYISEVDILSFNLIIFEKKIIETL